MTNGDFVWSRRKSDSQSTDNGILNEKITLDTDERRFSTDLNVNAHEAHLITLQEKNKWKEKKD